VPEEEWLPVTVPGAATAGAVTVIDASSLSIPCVSCIWFSLRLELGLPASVVITV